MIKLSYTKAALLESFRDVLCREVENKSPFSISLFFRCAVVLTFTINYKNCYAGLDLIENVIKFFNFDYCEICFN